MQKEIQPEIIAIITAAIRMLYGKNYVAVRMQRESLWTIAGRLRH